MRRRARRRAPSPETTPQRPESNSRTSRKSARVVSKRTSVCGCGIAASLNTAGAVQNAASAQILSHGRAGNACRTTPRRRIALATAAQGRQKLHGCSTLAEVEEVTETEELPGNRVPSGGRVVARRCPETVLEDEVAGVAQMLGSVDAGNRGEDEGIADRQPREGEQDRRLGDAEPRPATARAHHLRFAMGA